MNETAKEAIKFGSLNRQDLGQSMYNATRLLDEDTPRSYQDHFRPMHPIILRGSLESLKRTYACIYGPQALNDVSAKIGIQIAVVLADQWGDVL